MLSFPSKPEMSGFYTFKWEHPASEVYVTGTFDNWSKSTKLDQEGLVFSKRVEVPVEKIYYKFVVDGNWVIDNCAPVETEDSGVQNNVLLPTDISSNREEMSHVATINSASPESTTAALAAAVPKEEKTANGDTALAADTPVETPNLDNVPGGFPETPAETPATEKVDPTPAPATEENQTFSVNPLPASDTAENPFTLSPGEPVPKDVGTQSLTSNVKLDKESYEAGAKNYPLGSMFLPEVVTPAEKRAAEGRGVLDIPPITGSMIPESSLPITSASEAAAAAKPADIPEIVQESQEKAHAPPEASAVAESVEKKAEVEDELLNKVPTEAPIPEPAVAPAASVPEIVKESQAEAGVPPEASSSTEAIHNKEAIEAELKREIPEAESTTETFPMDKGTMAAAGVVAAPAAEESAAQISNQTAPVFTDGVTSTQISAREITLNKPVEEVPAPVQESIAEAKASPEAAASATAVHLKSAVEEQIKSDIPTIRAVQPETSKPAISTNAPPASTTAATKASPLDTAVPAATNGTTNAGSVSPVNGASNGIDRKSADSRKSADEPVLVTNSSSKASSTEEKKSKRRSIFGKFKEMLFH